MLTKLLLCGAVAGTALALAGSAVADPSGAKNATVINATCDGLPVSVVVNGNGEFTPAHVVGSTQVFVPTSFDTYFTFTPTGGSPSTEHDTSAKKAPLGNLTTCSIPLQDLFSGPEGTATIMGTVTGFMTPR